MNLPTKFYMIWPGSIKTNSITVKLNAAESGILSRKLRKMVVWLSID